MLIIYAHPNKAGHCGNILKNIKKDLDEFDVKYDVLDLYEMGYDPVLAQKEHYTSGNKYVSYQNTELQKKFKSETKFIFIYPTWWNNVPAILKGFVDRIFVSGFAFKYDGKLPKGLLSGSALVITTTGSPNIFYNTIAMRKSLTIMTNDTLAFCGFKTKGISIGSASKLTDKNKYIIKKKVADGLKWLLKK